MTDLPGQGMLFGDGSRPIEPNETVPEPARKRTKNQAQAILARLKQGPATNRELCDMAMNYRARLSEIRQAGYNVKIISQDQASGYALYAIV